MLRSSLTTAGVVLLGASALAQSDLSSRLRPITTKVKNAGVLHLGTGTWTRHATGQANLAGPDILYNNTCNTGYFGAQIQNEIWTDEGAIPNATMPDTQNFNIPGGFDTSPGCQSSYTINGFQIAYCSNRVGTVDVNVNFYDNYEPLAGPPCTVPGAPTAAFNITGLPGGVGGGQGCWLVSFDLDAAAATFSLTGSDPTTNNFGWSFGLVSAPPANNTDGPIIAGGTLVGGSPQTCTGTDGTRWDHGTASVAYPGNYGQVGNFPAANEEGTGMSTLDAFRIDGSTTASAGPGCYFFLGNPIGSFHLELYGNGGTCSAGLGQQMCNPGASGVITCPCGNSPAGTDQGCNNSANTGGGKIAGTGNASVSNDTAMLTASSCRPNSTSLFLQGNLEITAGVVFGDGVRCAGGSLLRLNSPGGTPTDGAGTVVYPNAGFPQSISARAAALGQPINAGDTRIYQTYYRDPDLNFCPNPPGNTWNVTNGLRVVWSN